MKRSKNGQIDGGARNALAGLYVRSVCGFQATSQ